MLTNIEHDNTEAIKMPPYSSKIITKMPPYPHTSKHTQNENMPPYSHTSEQNPYYLLYTHLSADEEREERDVGAAGLLGIFRQRQHAPPVAGGRVEQQKPPLILSVHRAPLRQLQVAPAGKQNKQSQRASERATRYLCMQL